MSIESFESLSRFDWQRLSSEVRRSLDDNSTAAHSVWSGSDIEHGESPRQEVRARINARIQASVMLHTPARLTTLLVAELVASGIRRLQMSATDTVRITDLGGAAIIRGDIGRPIRTTARNLARAIDPQAEVFSTGAAARSPFAGTHTLSVLYTEHTRLLERSRDLIPENAMTLPLIFSGHRVQVGPVTSATSIPCVECVYIAFEPPEAKSASTEFLRLPAESMLASVATDLALRFIDTRGEPPQHRLTGAGVVFDTDTLTVSAVEVPQSPHCGCQLQLAQEV